MAMFLASYRSYCGIFIKTLLRLSCRPNAMVTGFLGRGFVSPQDRFEACPATPVEVRYALRVLAEQGRFGR